MNIKRSWSLAFAVAGGFSLAAAPAVTDTPYGVCAHVSRVEMDFNYAQQEFQLMRDAGISYARTDFDWVRIEQKPGSWDFSHLDQIISLAKQKDIRILPILAYGTPWANPPWRNLDAWGEYVRRTVSCYAKDLRYWEVWNEENNPPFWGGNRDPKAAEYVSLLKRSYEEIKKIEPNLNVGYGGTFRVPLRYIEESFKAGAGAHFDFMNIHPYHWEGTPEDMIPEIRNLKALMKRYNVGDKPIWITEIGWWDPPMQPAFFQKMLEAVLRRAGIDPAKTAATVVCDPGKGFAGAALFVQNGYLAMFRRVDGIGLDQLRGLSVKRCPVLVPTNGEYFPARYIPELVDYVKRGGTLILPSGLPFYFDVHEDGEVEQINDKYMKDFHIGWETSWTNKNVPKQESRQTPAAGFENAFQITQTDFQPAGRFLHGRNLKPGDEFIPVIAAGTDAYQGTVAALYKLNSDLKGNIIVCTKKEVAATSESSQAEMLPRMYLVALANGVERIFWFNFRSPEFDPHNFDCYHGFVRKNLEPKLAFRACQTLTRLCPSGSTAPALTRKGETYLSGWTRPDGTKVWAVWNMLPQRKIRLDIQGNVTEALNHLGEKQPVPGSEAVASPAILYLVGPDSVTINPL